MECLDAAVLSLSWALIVGGAAFLLHQTRRGHARYGRYLPAEGRCLPAEGRCLPAEGRCLPAEGRCLPAEGRCLPAEGRCLPARLAWFLQEVPAFLLPLLLLLLTEEEPRMSGGARTGRKLLLCTFMLHYFHRSFIYAFLTRGRPVPLPIVFAAAVFCSLNGFLQGHHLLHCAQFEHTWLSDARLAAGFLLFVVGMIINIHSDHILRSLRRPGETVYRIPYGGMFEFVSGANFLGEILEWSGYAVAAWSLPTTAFAFFTVCSIGPRACQHHRDYQQRFEDYPRSRKALLPFIL